MLFNSIEFLIFLPLTLGLYFQTRGSARIWVTLAACYIFYGWWEPLYLPLIIASTLITYISARQMAKAGSGFAWLAFGLGGNLAMLFFFKYFNFAAEIFCGLAGIGPERCAQLDTVLPVGISFYTFQAISYLIDVRRDRSVVVGNLRDYAYFHAYFPQLVAGPIERIRHLLPQLMRPASPTYESLQSGLLLIAWGLFLKVVIADKAAIYVDHVYAGPEGFSGGHLLLATALFAYQIFCDFAGYSTMAVGIARIMGIELMANFRRPYFARSIREFWQRWHISLSTWFRDYVYIPMGGDRVGKLRLYFNIVMVFLVSGLWHGANWTFVVWGTLHGLALALERLLGIGQQTQPAISRGWIARMTAGVASRFWVLGFVGLSWIFFRAQNLDHAQFIILHLLDGIQLSERYLGNLLVPFTGDSRGPAHALVLFASIAVLESVHWIQEYRPALARRVATTRGRWAMILVLLTTVALLGEHGARSFIYFQF